MTQPKPPSSARSGKGSKHDPYWINTRPLTEPVNAFRFLAHQIRENLEEAKRRGAPADVRAAMEQSADWLDYVGQNVHFESNNPVICLAVARTALDGPMRAEMTRALGEVHNLIAAAEGRTG